MSDGRDASAVMYQKLSSELECWKEICVLNSAHLIFRKFNGILEQFGLGRAMTHGVKRRQLKDTESLQQCFVKNRLSKSFQPWTSSPLMGSIDLLTFYSVTLI